MIRARRRPVLLALALAAGALLTAFAFLWMLTTSVKPLGEARRFPPTIVPSKVSFDSYLRLFRDLDFGTYLVNTVVVVLISFEQLSRLVDEGV